jgi:hypothetical protein
MSINRPRLDEFVDQAVSPQTEAVLAVKGVEQFCETEEGREYLENYASGENEDRLLNWTVREAVPVTKRNLQIAFRELVECGQLVRKPEYTFDNPQYTPAPRDKYAGITRFKSTVVLRHPIGNDAQRQLVGERPERLQEILGDDIAAYEAELFRVQKLSTPGAPVSSELKQEYQQSLRKERKAAKKVDNEMLKAARVAVLEENPELDINSAPFRKAVSIKVSEYLQE